MIKKYITNLNDKVYNKPIECINCYSDEIIKINKDHLQYYTQNLDEIQDKLYDEQKRKVLNFHTSFPNMLHHDIYYMMDEQQVQETICISIDNVDASDGNETIVLDFDKVTFENDAFAFLVLTNIKCTVYIKNCQNMHLDVYNCNKIILENCKLHYTNTNTDEYNDKIFHSEVEFIKCRLCYSIGIYINGVCVVIEDEYEDSEDVKGNILFYLKGGNNRIIVDTDAENRLYIDDKSYNSENIYEGLEIVNLNKARGFDNITKAYYFDELIRGLNYKYNTDSAYDKKDFSHFAFTIHDLDCFTENEKNAIRDTFNIDNTNFSSTNEYLKDGMKFIIDCIATINGDVIRTQLPCILNKISENKWIYNIYSKNEISEIHSATCIFSISEYNRNMDIEPVVDIGQINYDTGLVNYVSGGINQFKFKPPTEFEFIDGHIYCLSGSFNIISTSENISVLAGLYNGSNINLLGEEKIQYTNNITNYTINSFFRYTNSKYQTIQNSLPKVYANDGVYLSFFVKDENIDSIITMEPTDIFLYDISNSIEHFKLNVKNLSMVYRTRDGSTLRFLENYNVMKYFWAFKATDGKVIQDINLIADENPNIQIMALDDAKGLIDITWDELKSMSGKNILVIGIQSQSLSNYPFYSEEEYIYNKMDLDYVSMYGKYPIITYKEVEDTTNANL